MRTTSPRLLIASVLSTTALVGSLALGVTACGGSSDDAATTTTSMSLAAGYKLTKWAAGMTVSYPSDCTMKVVATGLPNHAVPAYTLMPAYGSYNTIVATTPDGLELTLRPDPGTVNAISLTFNICPTRASAVTLANNGTIGTMISGAALFNPYDVAGSPAMSQNVSYNFTDSSGAPQTASFIDSCNGHYTPAQAGSMYHYHGVSSCLTAQVDVADGPSHIIGVALDGFPVYGGRDVNGKVITTDQLDACNGITSATPEFPDGVYHYVLPEGVTNGRSSLNCYSGEVSTQKIAQAQAGGICSSTDAVTNGRTLLASTLTPSRRLRSRSL